MQRWRRKPTPGIGFVVLAAGAVFAGPAIVFTLAQAIVGSSMASLLASLTAGLGFLLLMRRYDLEPIGPTRSNPDPEDHVLSARERLGSIAAGFAFVALTLATHFLLPALGLRNDSMIAEVASVVSAFAALALIVRGLYGVDHAHLPD